MMILLVAAASFWRRAEETGASGRESGVIWRTAIPDRSARKETPCRTGPRRATSWRDRRQDGQIREGLWLSLRTN